MRSWDGPVRSLRGGGRCDLTRENDRVLSKDQIGKAAHTKVVAQRANARETERVSKVCFGLENLALG
jgi:hypothetical protein